MKAIGKKLFSLLLAGTLTFSLAACGSGSTDSGSTGGDAASGTSSSESTDSGDSSDGGSDLGITKSAVAGDSFKIGVLVSDATSAEALGRRAYLEKYIAEAYNVEFVYSDELADSAGEKSAIETMITNNCKAILSESSFDRPAQIEQCEDAGIYYAVGAGALEADSYETYKGYEYFVGSVGPSDDTEFATGYAMAKHYLDQGVKNVTIFGGAVAYRNSMHINRVAGMLSAMIEAGGDGAAYNGATDPGEIIGMLYADGEVTPGDIGDVTISGYLGGYDMDDAWFAKGAEMVQASGVEVLLAVGNGSDFFGTSVKDTDVKIASVDAYAQEYLDAMDAGTLDYLAGKFSAYDGPIFMALYRAVNGDPLRNNDGDALALDMGYWVSTSAAECKERLEADGDVLHPVWDASELDTLYDADYSTFEAFVSDYAFEDIK